MTKMTTQRYEVDELAEALRDMATHTATPADDMTADAAPASHPCPVCDGRTRRQVDDPVVLYVCAEHGAFLMPD